MNPVTAIIRQERRNSEEFRRGTVVGDQKIVPYDTAGLRARVTIVSVDINSTRVIEGVIVQSPTGTGGKQYATDGRPVLIRRSDGGRWICVGPSDVISRLGAVQEFDESTGVIDPPVTGVGFSTERRPFNFWLSSSSNVWGSAGFADTRVFDADGNEVL